MKINPYYVSGQLERALALGQSEEKVRKWRQAFDGLVGGSLAVGSRTPVANVPAWATLEVVQGGFATGSLLAGGALQPHELELEAKLEASDVAPGRTALNLYYLSDTGREELGGLLRTGCYRIGVPEEGALLTVAWLLEHGATDAAQRLLEAIAPFFDRLRFYPTPHSRPPAEGRSVKRQPIAATIANLKEAPSQKHVLAMNEALAIWTPLYDRAVALFTEVIAEDCRVYPAGWTERAEALLAEYTKLRAAHGRCGKPEKKKASFTRLRGYLARAASTPPTLTAGDVKAIRMILTDYAAKYGAPGSEKLARLRAEQAEMAARPTHAARRAVAVQRLAALNDEGLSSLDAFADMPGPILRKLQRSLEAPIEDLVAQGVLPSAEVLAAVLPPMTSQIRAAAIPDPDLRRVYAAVYAAFRRRRSLLLVNLEQQVKLEELPWVAAMNAFRTSGDETAARDALRQVSLVALKAYPQTILPNKLVTELRALASSAKLDIPFVGELAADIFMGEFAPPFLRAAQIAGRVLAGSLYERYYGLPYDEVARLGDVHAFGSLCHRLVPPAPRGGSRTAANGAVLERAQLLTTHNLAPLFADVDLAADAPPLARACFAWVCHSQQRKRDSWHSSLRMMKNTAYAWRQMLFLLAVGAERADTFMRWAEEHFAKQTPAFRARFAPAVLGLRAVIDGGSFDADDSTPNGGRRFLGWTTERHWAFG